MTTIKVDVRQCEYHRNGISGVGFYAIRFDYTEGSVARSAIATVDAEDVDRTKAKKRHDPQTRVLMFNPDTLAIDVGETMRGDHFHEPLIKWIIGHYNDAHSWKKKVA